MNLKYDVIIVGSGVAGLYCALNLDESLKVLVVSKSNVELNNTYLAQGGISTARNDEDIPFFIEDTLKAGKYKNKLESVKILANESIKNIKKIRGYGLNLDKENGKILYTREGAHCVNRIVHNKDKTGRAVFETLIKEVRGRSNIDILEHTYLIDILSKENKCIGGKFFIENEGIDILSKILVLATGGIGGLFKNSTNQRHLTGDGIAVALKNNIKIKDLNYIQIHPTAFYEENKSGRRLLISESVRGEGGKLLNKKGERFVDELLPRDIVTKYINEEMKKDNEPYVYLDVTHMDKEYLKNRFSFIYSQCLSKGVDITKEYIKVSPAQHYFMGGIEVDLNSKTSMENLYAVGEVSCTGVHGANRLASNSLLEGLVFSNRASNDINKSIEDLDLELLYKKDKNNNISIDIDKINLNNRKIVINEIKRLRKDLSDELFEYR